MCEITFFQAPPQMAPQFAISNVPLSPPMVGDDIGTAFYYIVHHCYIGFDMYAEYGLKTT